MKRTCVHTSLLTFVPLLLVFCATIPAAEAGNSTTLGTLDAARAAYNVLHYSIDLQVNPKNKSIAGSNLVSLHMLDDAVSLRFDLAENMQCKAVLMHGRALPYQRKGARIYVQLPSVPVQEGRLYSPVFAKDSLYQIKLQFSGKPQIARLPPWDGGFVWSQDQSGNPWVGLACESIGPSVWLPCKDHWSDEADSIDMRLAVPFPLIGVSNGSLMSVQPADSGYRTFHWKVVNPINGYNISINAADYVHLSDTFSGINTLPLDYYVLRQNEQRAAAHFTQTEPMLRAFEHYFGPYPFFEDGYKLVETPYWGMEHQSCVAYGNNYKNNSYGFDFIIVHESGHEWFANSITASDPADMWIHESFTTYSEALYIEYTQNRVRAEEYLLEQRKKIVSKRPLQGPRDVYFHGQKDNDIYYKGSWMLHTMRSILGNDTLWVATLRDLNKQFYHNIVSTEDVCSFFNGRTGYNWDLFFNQYIQLNGIPELYIKQGPVNNGTISYTFRLKKMVHDLHMPLNIRINSKETLSVMLSETEVSINLPVNFDVYRYIQANYLLNIKRR